MNLQSDETDLVGSWVLDGGRVTSDAIERRIEKLICSHVEKISVSAVSGARKVLYRDPNDGRFLELTYPHGEMHGGGPKRLTHLSATYASAKYRNSESG